MNNLFSALVATGLGLHTLISTCFAEPNSTIQYVTSESVSLFDRGAHQLQRDLKEGMKDRFPELEVGLISIDLSDKMNSIVILGIQELNPKTELESVKEAKRRCKDIISAFKNLLHINANTGKVDGLFEITGRKTSTLATHYFSHHGYKKSNEPKNLAQDLDDITEITAGASTKDMDVIRCKSMLREADIFYTEKLNKEDPTTKGAKS